MRILTIALLLALVALVGSCRGSIDERASSELKIFGPGDALLSDGDDWGTVELTPGETFQLKVTRTTSEANSDIIVEDVTTEVSWDLKTPGIANISPGGLITANATGVTEVQVEFNDGDSDTTDNDVTRFFINVDPAN